MNSKKVIKGLLKKAGIEINGKNPWDIKINNEKIYQRVLKGGSISLGESYMEGWWDCEKLDEFFFRLIRSGIDKDKIGLKKLTIPLLKTRLLNLQRKNSYDIGEKHYDIGNNLYELMLDKNMQYSCAYWKNAKNLEKAQINKMNLICKKINLKKGETLLDIGCGWGGFLKYASEKYCIKGTGLTVSKEQEKYAKKNFKNNSIKIRVMDYKNINKKFDKIVSIGMMEHVGYKNYKNFIKIAHKCLKKEGIFLIQTIGSNRTNKRPTDPWLDKYIFPNGKTPSLKQIIKASERLFLIEDLHNFGADYDKTLLAWNKNFKKNWNKINKEYDEKFYRMWTYYLLMCAGIFRARKEQLWQIVLTKKGILGGYKSIR